jgi:hypothetical protein
MMHILPSQLRTYLRGTLGCLTILAQIFILSSCASKLNLVPENYSAILEREIQTKMVRTIVRSQAARLDYAIPVAVNPVVVNPDEQQIEIHWSKNGESTVKHWYKFWEGEPFWKKATYWRFALLEQTTPSNKETPALCYTEWSKVGSDDITSVPCKFRVNNYIGKPLIGSLDFRLGGDEEKAPGDDEITEGVVRLYYIVLK